MTGNLMCVKYNKVYLFPWVFRYKLSVIFNASEIFNTTFYIISKILVKTDKFTVFISL